MKFPGKVHPKKVGEKYHSVEIPTLGIYTQGKSFKDAMAMAKDALEELLGIEIEISPWGKKKDAFTVTSKDLKPLVARFLEIRREKAGLTIKEVTERLGRSAVNYYAQYEQGRSLPGLEKLREFTDAMPGDEDDMVLIA